MAVVDFSKTCCIPLHFRPLQPAFTVISNLCVCSVRHFQKTEERSGNNSANAFFNLLKKNQSLEFHRAMAPTNHDQRFEILPLKIPLTKWCEVCRVWLSVYLTARLHEPCFSMLFGAGIDGAGRNHAGQSYSTIPSIRTKAALSRFEETLTN